MFTNMLRAIFCRVEILTKFNLADPTAKRCAVLGAIYPTIFSELEVTVHKGTGTGMLTIALNTPKYYQSDFVSAVVEDIMGAQITEKFFNGLATCYCEKDVSKIRIVGKSGQTWNVVFSKYQEDNK